MEGVIFDIKRFAIHDGPGIRTTVFLKGCPLNCFWCHNPESRKAGVEEVSRQNSCETSTLGWKIDSKSLLDEILLDQVFYEHSEGGVTFSGGEPTMQSKFLLNLLMLCKENGIHTTVDTSGYTSRNVLEKIIPYSDLFLFDLKMINRSKHEEHTGVDNQLILDNLRYLDEKGVEYHLRIPFIPGINDTKVDLDQLISFIGSLKQSSRVHLLPYHKTGLNKYKKFGIQQTEIKTDPPDQNRIGEVSDYFKNQGINLVLGG